MTRLISALTASVIALAMTVAQPAMAHCPMTYFELMTPDQISESDDFRRTAELGMITYDIGKATTKAIIREATNGIDRTRSFDRFVSTTDGLIDNYEVGFNLAFAVIERVAGRIEECESHPE